VTVPSRFDSTKSRKPGLRMERESGNAALAERFSRRNHGGQMTAEATTGEGL
jgi:hypothetical protein